MSIRKQSVGYYPWQGDEWNKLFDLKKQNRLPHALLMCGRGGIGKRHLADAYLQWLLCSAPGDSGACNVCKSCQLILADAHPDLLRVSPEDDSKIIKIERIRSVGRFVAQTAQLSAKKLILIEPAEAMNNNAANALLKNLEEPTPNTILVLISDQPHKLLPTLRSRCQVFHCRASADEESVKWLMQQVSDHFDIACDQTTISNALKLSDNRPLKALDLITNQTLKEQQLFAADLDLLMKQKTSVVGVAAKWSSKDSHDALQILSCWLMDMIRMVSTSGGAEVRDDEQKPFYDAWLGRLRVKDNHQRAFRRLFVLNERLIHSQQLLESSANPNKQLLLENVLIEWQQTLSFEE